MRVKQLLFIGVLPLVQQAVAQTTPFTISALSITLTGVNNTYTTALTGTGTAVVASLGNATVSMTGSSTRERGLNCGNYVRMAITFTFSASDSLAIGITFPTASVGTPQPFSVTGGTGLYQVRGGSGTLTATLTGSVISGTGSGTLTGTLATPASIYPSGIVPVFSSVPIVQPASWISIYGTNLASSTAVWSSGVFVTSLNNVSVTIDNKPAYLWLVSAGQINVQVPDDAVRGCVNVVVTTPNGTAASAVTLQPQQPSFSLLSPKYVVAEIPTPDGSGFYGSGTASYDLAGPSGAFSFNTRPVKAGETVVLFGVGFGPTATNVPAGQFPAGATPTNALPDVTIGGVHARVLYAGLVGAGLYQLNVVVPTLPVGDRLIQANLAASPILFLQIRPRTARTTIRRALCPRIARSTLR